MTLRLALAGILLLAMMIPVAVSAAATPEALQAYTLTLVKLPLHSWVGNAVYLGKGRILTASHVAGSIGHPSPVADIAGVSLTTRRIKQGRLDDVDLSLLQVDAKALPATIQALPTLSICTGDASDGTPVVVITPHQIAPSHIVTSAVMPPWIFSAAVIAAYPTLIADVYTTGNSGSGVFDPAGGCLLGIMSRKIELTKTTTDTGTPVTTRIPIAKYFVGPKVIQAFLAGTGSP